MFEIIAGRRVFVPKAFEQYRSAAEQNEFIAFYAQLHAIREHVNTILKRKAARHASWNSNRATALHAQDHISLRKAA